MANGFKMVSMHWKINKKYALHPISQKFPEGCLWLVSLKQFQACLIEISLPVSVSCTDLFYIWFLLVFVLLCPLWDIWVTAAARAVLPIPLSVRSIFVCPNNA